MPHLRFTKDRRGYEHIALVQEVRRKGRERHRILYVFRTPPGVRIGRDAFDPATQELIERANPDVVFDWDAILESRPAVPVEEPPLRRTRAGRNGQPGAPARGSVERQQGPEPGVPPLDRVLGRDAAMRLRQRYAAIRQRLDESTGLDEERQAVCRERLTGLDPDSWGAEESISERAAGFDASIEEVRRLLGLPRRRARRGRREQGGASAAAEAEALAPDTVADSGIDTGTGGNTDRPSDDEPGDLPSDSDH